MLWIIACPFRHRHSHSLVLLGHGLSSVVPVMQRFSYGAVSKLSGVAIVPHEVQPSSGA
jgi:hypothetical protein